MATWLMRIKRGSTLRVPLTITDRRGLPVSFSSASAQLIPENGSPAPIDLTVGNSKLLQPAYAWRGEWNAATLYVIGDAVLYGDKYYRAVQPNTNTAPRTSTDWEFFAQFTLLVSAVETAGYNWSAGEYKLDVVFSNSDIEESYIKGPIKVTDD